VIISDFETTPDCLYSPPKKLINPDILDDDLIMNCAVASSNLNDLDNSLQIDFPPGFANITTIPISNAIPSVEIEPVTEPDTDTCVDI